MSWRRRLLATMLAKVARWYLATLRVHVTLHPRLLVSDAAPWVLCFFHGDQAGLLAWKRRGPTAALVSHSRDGDLQSALLAGLGMLVHRGSSSRGGARGLMLMVRSLRRGHDAAFAVDGPRGPRWVAKPGARTAAVRTGARLIPLSSASRSGLEFGRSWDRLCLPAPFARVSVVLGEPLDPCEIDDELLSLEIARTRDIARSNVGVLPSPSR